MVFTHRFSRAAGRCILYELTTLKHAFDAQSLKLLVMKIVRGNYPPVSKMYSPELRGLVDRMIKKDPRQRPTVNEILALPFIKQHIGGFLSQVTVRARTCVPLCARSPPETLLACELNTARVRVPGTANDREFGQKV